MSICSTSTIQRESARREYFFSTGMDRWYETLKEETFATKFIRMTTEEGQAILSHRKRLYENKPPGGCGEEATLDVSIQLKSLQMRIDDAIASLSPEAGVFVKLATRSPKDSQVAYAKARETFLSELPSLGDNPSANDKLILLAEAMVRSLRVRTGEEAIRVLVSSARVEEDLEYALDPDYDDFEKCMCLVVRKWTDIHLWAEFRSFVWDGKLTSIGQYNHPLYFRQLVDRRERIKADLESFFASVKDRIPLDRYTVDLAWTEDKVYIIEVNTFDGEFNASTGLWNWADDREQMMKGPLELRVREREQDFQTLMATLEPEWKVVVFPGTTTY